MKKGCYFIGAPGGAGAVANHFTALALELAERGNRVKIISHSEDDIGEFEKLNPESLVWPSPRPTRFADALFLARLIRTHRPDCLLANFAAVNWMCLVGWWYRVACRMAFYHTLSSQMQSDVNGAASPLKGMSTLRKRFVYRTATCVAGISRAALLDAQTSFGIPAHKCKFWRYSMPDPARDLPLQSMAGREDLVVCAGRLSRSKGQDVLISALGLNGKHKTCSTVEFLGTGPMLGSLRQLAEQLGVAGRCRFVGQVSQQQVLARMARARVTVVPSRHEAFGLVNIESMSVGTPVIASRVDGIQESVRDGVDGYLIPPGDAPALAEKLTAVLQDSTLRERLGGNARRHFLDHYENSRVVRTQADWLEQYVSTGNGGKSNGS